MRIDMIAKWSSGIAAGILCFSAAAPAQAPAMKALSGLQNGAWIVKGRGDTGSGKRICLGDPAQLIQMQHGGANCSRYVIEDSPNSLRVSYKCGASGHGVTTIRKESSGLLQIQSQGIYNNAPFSMSAEARRSGSC